MLYSDLLTRNSAALAILLSIYAPFTTASPEAQGAALGSLAATPAAIAPAAAASVQPSCSGVPANVIPLNGPGQDPNALGSSSFYDGSGSSSGSSSGSDSGLGLGSGSGSGSSSGLGSGSSSGLGSGSGLGPGMRRRDLSPESMLIHERQTTGATNQWNGGPIAIPAGTSYCGFLSGMGAQSDLFTLPPGIHQMTWQNVTGDGQISINYSQAGAASSWAPQDSETPDSWPTIEAFANDGVKYQAVYLGEYPANGLTWFMTKVA